MYFLLLLEFILCVWECCKVLCQPINCKNCKPKEPTCKKIFEGSIGAVLDLSHIAGSTDSPLTTFPESSLVSGSSVFCTNNMSQD